MKWILLYLDICSILFEETGSLSKLEEFAKNDVLIQCSISECPWRDSPSWINILSIPVSRNDLEHLAHNLIGNRTIAFLNACNVHSSFWPKPINSKCSHQMAYISCLNSLDLLFPKLLPNFCTTRTKDDNAHKHTFNDGKKLTVAFLLTLSGRSVNQVVFLLNQIYRHYHQYVIHVDLNSEFMLKELTSLLQRYENIHFASKRYPTVWGSTELLQAHFSVFEELLQKRIHFDFIINLSESDLLIQPVEVLEEFLSRHRHSNFLFSADMLEHEFISKQGLNMVFWQCNNQMNVLGQRLLPYLKNGYSGASDWFAIGRNFVEYIMSDSDLLVRGLKEVFKYALLPAESFYHTLLANSHLCHSFVNNDLHSAFWKKGVGCTCKKSSVDWCGCSPLVFRSRHFKLLSAQRNMDKFFARKFDGVIDYNIMQMTNGLSKSSFKQVPSLFRLNLYSHEFDAIGGTISILSQGVQQLFQVFLAENGIIELPGKLLRMDGCFTTASLSSVVHTFNKYELHAEVSNFSTIFEPNLLEYFEVTPLFDDKENISRNYHHFISSNDFNLQLVFKWRKLNVEYVVAVYDPSGVLAFTERESSMKLTKLKLRFVNPLCPGVWKAYVMQYDTREMVSYLEFPVLTSALNANVSSTDFISNYTNVNPEYGCSNVRPSCEVIIYNFKWFLTLLGRYWNITDVCERHIMGTTFESCNAKNWSSFALINFYDF